MSWFPFESGLCVSNYSGENILNFTLAGDATEFVDNTHGFSGTAGMVFDTNDNLYVASRDNNIIFKVTSDGTVSLFAEVEGPQVLAVDAAGNIFARNPFTGGTIHKIAPEGEISSSPTKGAGRSRWLLRRAASPPSSTTRTV